MTILAVALAALLRWLLNPVLGDNLPYPTFFVTVAFAAWWGGWRTTLLATLLGLLCAVLLFVPLQNSDSSVNLPNWLGLGLYLLVCSVFAIFGESMHRSNTRFAEAAERLRTTMASIGDAVITTDKDGRITNMNAVAESLTHWQHADAIGRPLESVFRIVNESTRKTVESPVLKALREGIVVGLANHTILLAKDGTEYAIDDSAAPIRCKEGEIVGCVLIFRDIGQQRSLQRQASILAAIVQSTDDAIISKDLDGIIQSWNIAAERLFGYRAEEVIGKPMLLVIPVDRHHEEVEILSGLRAGIRIEHFDTVRVRKDGRLIQVSICISPIRDESGAVIGASKIVRDVTEKKLSEERLRMSEERKTAILNAALDCIISIDHQSQIIEFNPAAEQIFGFKRDEVLGRDLSELIIPPTFRGLHKQGIERYLVIGQSKILDQRLELTALRANGKEFPVELSVTRIHTSGMPIFTAFLRDITERKSSEAAIYESEQFNRSVFESSPDCVKVLDAQGRILQMNKNGLCLMEIDDFSALEGSAWCDLWPDDSRDDVLGLLESAQKEGVGRLQRICPTAKGKLKWWDVMVAPVLDKDGALVRFVSVSRDISEREQAAATLRASEEKLRLAVSAAKLGQWTLDLTTNVMNCTDTCKANYGRATNDLFTYDELWESVHPLDRTRVQIAVTAAIETHTDYDTEYRNIWPDGSVHWVFVRGRATYSTEGTPLSITGVTLDITERKRVEEKLREAEEQFRTLAENMSQLAWMADAQGLIYWYNQRWYDYTGTTLDEMQGWGWKNVHHPEHVERVVTRIQHSWDTGEVWEDTFPLRSKDGAYRWFLSRARPIRNEQGDLIRWFGTNTDVTEERETAEKLRVIAAELSKADNRKDEFLATLAHELRNPLAPIRNGLELMKLCGNQPEMLEESRAMMERQLEQMVRLVDDLMDVSRISRGKLELKIERLELSAVISNAVETSLPLINEMGHTLSVHVTSEPICVDADFVRLSQVFLNLLNNAAKYSERGGQIQLTAEIEEGMAVITVKDQGIGIAADQLPRIFELFSQVDQSLEKAQGGLGIGLSLVKRLVLMHGGKVEARSEGLGRGSEFIIQLPTALESESKKPTVDQTQELQLFGLKILIVDDNQDSANSLAIMLKFMANEIRTGYDGLEAVTIAEEFQPDVILLDIGLPKLNGYEACRQIRNESDNPELVIIAQTGWGTEDDQQRTREAGFDHHFVKPIDPKILLKTLATLRSKL